MIISTIVAIAKGGVIGKDNDIPWYLPADLKYFKKRTSGHHIIMGRKCYQSIGKPLPKRTNVILTRNPFFLASSCIVCPSLEEAIALARRNGETEAFIIGGGEIYKQSMALVDRVYLTEVDVEVDGKKEELIYFPALEEGEWKMIEEEKHQADEKNKFNYTFKTFERIDNG